MSKTIFVLGFRSYVRPFLGAILMLLRPLVPWCFHIREVSFGCNFDASLSFTAMVFSHPEGVF